MKMFSRWFGLGTVRSLFQRRRFRAVLPAVCQRRRRRLSLAQQPETLERRFAFDVAAFAAEGLEQATLVVSGGDDLYFSQVATSPPSLLYGTSSSYLGDEFDAGVIPNFASKTKLMIAEGREVAEDLIKADGSPAWGQPGLADETFFLPQHVPHLEGSYSDWFKPLLNINYYSQQAGGSVLDETRGTIMITQPDGAVSVWGFTNWNQQTQSVRFNNKDMVFVEGPNKGGQFQYYGEGITPPFQAITPGYYYPESIQVESDVEDPGGPNRKPNKATPTGFRVRWNQPLSATTNPILTLESYQTETNIRITGETVRASAYANNFFPPTSAAGAGTQTSDQYLVDFTLKEAEGQGLIPGAFFGTAAILPFGILGEVAFAGTDISVTDGNEGVTTPLSGFEGAYRLQFKQSNGSYANTYLFDNQNVGQQSSSSAPGAIGPLDRIEIEGFYNTQQGTATLLFQSNIQGEDYAFKPGRVELRDVRYAVYEASSEADTQSNVYVEPGLDLKAAVTVEMLTPGAALYVNNPIAAFGGNLGELFSSPVADGAIALRASEIYLNADIQADLRVDIGNTTERAQKTSAAVGDATGATLAIYRDPTAVLNVQGGSLSAMQTVQGFEGSGYPVGSRPKVVVSSPKASLAEISAGRLIGGIYDIGITEDGDGYTQYDGWTPLKISPPELAGWDEDNDGVIDYPSVQATAEANYVGGKITGVKITNPGFGYVAPPTITIQQPAKPPSKNPAFTPIQAELSPLFGGVLTSLSVDYQGYNYKEQAEGFFDPDEEESSSNVRRQVAAGGDEREIATVTLTAYKNAGGSGRLDQFVVYPLVGPGRFIARAKLPDGGLRGGVTLDAVDTDNNGEVDTTVVTGVYTWRASLDENGELDPFYTVDVSSPPSLDPSQANRAAVDAVVGKNGRIERYDFATESGYELRGQGYGVIPGYFVVPPVTPREPSPLVVDVGDAGEVAAIRPDSPHLVFDVAQSLDSFLENDADRPLSRQALANLDISFGAETITVGENDDGSIDGEWGSISGEIFDAYGFELGAESLYEARTDRILVLQENVEGSWEERLKIAPSALTDESVFFEGKLVALKDTKLSTLRDRLDVASHGLVDAISENFGKTYRLIVQSDLTLTHIAANGVRTSLAAADTPESRRQSIGKAYPATGAGYRAEDKPIVQIQQSSADKEAAIFTTVLDEDGKIRSFERVDGGSGYEKGLQYTATVTPLRNLGATEVVEFNSSIQSDHFDVRVGDDIRDDSRTKGELYVSPLTTLRRGVNAEGVSLPATSTYIEADTADIFVAGQVNATTQSYVLQSPIYRQLDGPFQFSTLNRDTGAQSGRLVGETMTLAFGAETSELSRTGSIITHVVDIDTNLSVAATGANNSNIQAPGSLRVTAGANRTDGIFPVSITVREATALAVDSNIRSSGQVTVTSGDSLEVNAAIETNGDLTLEGGPEGSRVTLSGPLKSTAGSISVQGGSVQLDADVEAGGDAAEGNVILRATAGDVIVSGTVRATRGGEIRIDQDDPVFASATGSYQAVTTTKVGDDGKTSTSNAINLPINDRETTTAVLTVPETQGTYNRVNVTLDITHGYTGDLVGTLVAPSGERYTLFNRRGWYYNNFTDVTFDNLASREIRSSYPPYSGAYQPEGTIGRPLDHTGQWKLEVFDAQTGYGGQLNSFGLEFIGGESNVNVTPGSVSGAGLLAAERIEIAAEGNVGGVGSGIGGLLRTAASHIEVRSDYGNVGVRDVDAAEFYVSAYGSAALQAGGADIVDRYGEVTAALRAEVRNATKVAVEAPRGSIAATVYGNDTVELAGLGAGSSPLAAGEVSIRVIEADAVITDHPIAGSARVAVDQVVKTADLPPSFEFIGDVEGFAAGVIRGTGQLDGFTVGQQVLLVGEEQQNSDQVSLVSHQLSLAVNGDIEVAGDNVNFGGQTVKKDQFSSNWQPILAGEFSGRRELVWGYSLTPGSLISQISVWSLDLTSTWDGNETIYGVADGGFQEVERRYNKDVDGNGSIGNALREADGQIRLEVSQAGQPLANGYAVTAFGQDVFENADWKAVAADKHAGTNVLVWQHNEQDGGFLLWVCGEQWQRREGLALPQPGTVEHATLEVSLNLDLNVDGVVGTLDGGGVRGDSAAIAVDGRIFISGKPLKKDGVEISTAAYPGWRILGTAVESDGTGSVLWGHVSGRVSLWEVDANSVWTGDGSVPSPTDAVEFATFEVKYGVNLTSAGFWSLMPTKTLIETPPATRVSYTPEKYAGIYIVTSTGGMATDWELVRAEAYNTGGEFADRTRIVDLSSGKNLQLERLVGQVGGDEKAVASRVVEVGETTTTVETSLGHSLTYVVTEPSGDNQTSGTLGRVLLLLEENREGNGKVPAIGFAASVGTMTPSQELPEITKSVAIDGDKRWLTVNGSGRLVDVTWEAVSDDNEGTVYVAQTADTSVPSESLEPLSKVALAGDRVVLDRAGKPLSFFGDDVIDGLVFSGVVGGQFDGRETLRVSELRNIEIGGFGNGASVLLNQSTDVVVDGVVLGSGGLTNQQGNRYGLRVAGSQRITLNRSQVTANETGVRVQDGDAGSEDNEFETKAVVSDNVVISGTTVGSNSGVGVDVTTKGRVTIGTMPTLSAIEVTLLQGQTSINLVGLVADPSTFFSRLYLGMPVSGSGLATGTTVAGFDAVSQEVSLSHPVAESSPRAPNNPGLRTTTAVSFGSSDVAEDRNVVRDNDRGIVLSDGIHSIFNTDVSGNVHSGIVIAGVSEELPNEAHHVGSLAARQIGGENIIAGNGGYGILLASDRLYSGPNELSRVDINGNNFFKAADTTQANLAIENAQGSIGTRAMIGGFFREEVFAASDFLPNQYTGADAHGNRHHVAAINIPVPAVPQNFAAKAVGAQVDLEWTEPVNSDLVESYVIYYSKSETGPWTLAAEYPAYKMSGSVANLDAYVPYWFQVVGRNISGDGPAATVGSVQVTAEGLPAAPTNLVARIDQSDGGLELIWEAPQNTGGQPIDKYQIQYLKNSVGEDSYELLREVNPGLGADEAATWARFDVDGVLKRGTTYSFRVKSHNDSGYSEGYAEVTMQTTDVPQDKPAALTVTPEKDGFRLNWAAVRDDVLPVTSYWVQQRHEDSDIWIDVDEKGQPEAEISDRPRAEGAYYFRVAAMNIIPAVAEELSWAESTVAVKALAEPSGVTGLQGDAGDKNVKLTWAAGDNGGKPIFDYIVEYRKVMSQDGEWKTVADGTSSATSVTVSGLSNGVDYEFQVTARTSVGDSVPLRSDPVKPLGPPTMVRGLVATATVGGVSLVWDAPESNGGLDIESYNVEYATSSLGPWKTHGNDNDNVDSSQRDAIITGLDKGTLYFFRVSVNNSKGTSPMSDVAFAIPTGVPDSPTALLFSPNYADGSLRLSWTAPLNTGALPVVEYQLQYKPGGESNWGEIELGNSTDLFAEVLGSDRGVMYDFRVRAKNSVGYGDWIVGNFEAPDTPDPPTGFSASSVAGQLGVIRLAWTAPIAAGGELPITSYVIQKSLDTDGGNNWETIDEEVDSTSNPYYITDLERKSEGYVFRVAAKNALPGVHESDLQFTDPSEPVKPLDLAEEVRLLQAIPEDEKILLSWNAPADTGGVSITDYLVEINDGTGWQMVNDGFSSTTGAVVRGLVNGIPYRVRVKPKTSLGVGVEASVMDVTPYGRPAAPAAPSVVGEEGSLAVSWPSVSGNGRPITDYIVQYAASLSGQWTDLDDGVSDSRSATISDRPAGTEWYVRVAAINEAGTGSFSTATGPVVV